jgi:PAS domain S-box-containing protein
MTRQPSAEELLEGVLELSRDLDAGQNDGTLCARYVRVLGRLFPARVVLVRLHHDGKVVVHAPDHVELSPAAERLPFVLRASALRKTGLGEAAVKAGLVQVAKTPPPVVVGAAHGISIPLVANGVLLGTLDVAARDAGADLGLDEPTLNPIANHLSVAIERLRNHTETAFLRDYLAQVIEHAGALIVGVDASWKIMVFNRALAELTGRDPAQMIGKDLRDFLSAKVRTDLEPVVADAFSGRPPVELEINHKTAEQRLVRTVWTITGIEGKTRAVIAVGQDRTRVENLQRQIIQAEKLATLGQLAAGVVHEINNPLTSVTVYAEYLLRKLERAGSAGLGVLEPADIDKLRKILEGAARILNLSRSLVRYGRPDEEAAELLSLSDVARQAAVFCEHIIERHKVKLELALAPALPPLLGVRAQLQQVCINLVTNAAHALPAEGGQVRIATRSGTGTVILEVADAGRGIPRADLERIFEPFFTTKTDGQGTGLGLSIVQRIVERHQGQVEVESTPGQGTRFVITLPVG